MTMIEFVGQGARNSENIAANTARLVNLYREPIAGGGRAQYLLKSVLGLQPFASPAGIYCRALGVMGGEIYAIVGDDLDLISAGGASTVLATVDGSGDTTIDSNDGKLTIVSGGNYYLWDGAALTNPAAGAFSIYSSHCYIGNYTVLTELNGRRFQWSDLADPSTLPGLNFSTADGRDDLLVRPFSINGTLYLFKERSHEIWYVTGGAGADAFQRQSGGVYDVGLKSHNLIAALPQAAFFVGSDGRAHVVSGTVSPVSIPAVEVAIRDCGPQVCFTYEDDGHTFCVITFRDCPAWVYDVATGEWHERGYGVGLGALPVTCSVKHDGEWICGLSDATLSKFARIGTDNGGALVREATSRTLYQDGARFKISQFELFPRQGFSENTIELSVSRDSGLTWSDPKQRQIGPVGNYGGRVLWRSLGQCRQITAKVRFSEDAAFSMLSEGRIA